MTAGSQKKIELFKNEDSASLLRMKMKRSEMHDGLGIQQVTASLAREKKYQGAKMVILAKLRGIWMANLG